MCETSIYLIPNIYLQKSSHKRMCGVSTMIHASFFISISLQYFGMNLIFLYSERGILWYYFSYGQKVRIISDNALTQLSYTRSIFVNENHYKVKKMLQSGSWLTNKTSNPQITNELQCNRSQWNFENHHIHLSCIPMVAYSAV